MLGDIMWVSDNNFPKKIRSQETGAVAPTSAILIALISLACVATLQFAGSQISNALLGVGEETTQVATAEANGFLGGEGLPDDEEDNRNHSHDQANGEKFGVIEKM